MMDNNAKANKINNLSDLPGNPNISLTGIMQPQLADGQHLRHDKEKEHLITAKYLPLDNFKNTQTLTKALDAIQRESNNLKRNTPRTKTRRNEINMMLMSLANNIAITTMDLHVDYTTKLQLIDTAAKHRLFQPTRSIKQYSSSFIRSIHAVMSYLLRLSGKYHVDYRSEAQKILDTGKISIIQSRNNIILC
jgi:hypothetical protein